jgi:hypothetical protein
MKVNESTESHLLLKAERAHLVCMCMYVCRVNLHNTIMNVETTCGTRAQCRRKYRVEVGRGDYPLYHCY